MLIVIILINCDSRRIVMDDSILRCIDDLVWQHILSVIQNPYDLRGLRATCREMRAAIPPAPRRSPLRMWKWANHRGFEDFVYEARDVGANALARCIGASEERECDHAARLWGACLRMVDSNPRASFSSEFCYQYDCRAIILGHFAATARICANVNEGSIGRRIITIIGKYADEANVMLCANTARRETGTDDAQNFERAVLDNLIEGAARANRDALCRRLIERRLSCNTESIGDLSCSLLFTAHPELHALIADHLDEFDRHWAIHAAATSNDRVTCEYARGLYPKALCIESMLDGATFSRGGNKMLALAREWLDDLCKSNGFVMIDGSVLPATVYITRSEFHSHLAHAAYIVARIGTCAAFEYLLDWIVDIGGVPQLRDLMNEAAQFGRYWIVDIICRRFPAIYSQFECSDDDTACAAVYRARKPNPAAQRAHAHADQK